MDAATKDWVEVITWTVGIVGGVAGLLNLAREYKQGRHQRGLELRWRKASAANDLLNTFYGDPVFRNAMLMLDWDNRPFQIADDKTLTIARDDIWAALARPPAAFDDKSLFIRTAMDRMFEAFDRIAHAIQIDMITNRDMEYALGFYITVLAPKFDLVEQYMTELGFIQAREFFRKHPEWPPRKDRPRG